MANNSADASSDPSRFPQHHCAVSSTRQLSNLPNNILDGRNLEELKRAPACIELSAIRARFSSQPPSSTHMNAFLADLDALIARWLSFLSLAQLPGLGNHRANTTVAPADTIANQAFALGHNTSPEQSFVSNTAADGNDMQLFGSNYLNPFSTAAMMDETPGEISSASGIGSAAAPVPELDVLTNNLAGSNIPWGEYVTGFQDLQDEDILAPDQQSVVQAASALQPFVSTAAPVNVVNQANVRYNCTGCMKTFLRRNDRDRHSRSHDPNATRISCRRQGCPFQSTRKDKVLSHQKCRRH